MAPPWLPYMCMSAHTLPHCIYVCHIKANGQLTPNMRRKARVMVEPVLDLTLAKLDLDYW